MTGQFELYDGDMVITYANAPEKNKEVVDAIINWCKKYRVYGNESFQNDDPNIEAPTLICDIMDILNFTPESKDDDF